MHAIILSSCVPFKFNQAIRPLGPYQIAWYLRSNGYEVQVLEYIYRLPENEIVELVEKFITPETKLLGMAFMIAPNHEYFKPISKKLDNVIVTLKKRYPQLTTVLGGGTVPYWSRAKKNKDTFDYFVKGYGEDATLALMNYLYKNAPHPQFELVDGNRHIADSFKMPQEQVFNIEESYHTWHERDCIQPGESLPIEFGRGCIFKCKFCRYPYIGKHKNDFNRSMDCIKNELIHNYEKWKVDTYYVVDDTFNADHERLKAFTNMVHSLPFKIRYGAFLRPDLLHKNKEAEEMFLNNGLVSTFIGIESFGKEASKLIDKPWSGKHAKDYIPELYHNKWKKKIHLDIGLIVGLPPDTLADLRETNKFLADNEIPHWTWESLKISRESSNYHRSEFDKNAEKYGFKWKVVDGRLIWYNEHTDHDEMVEWYVTLLNEAKPYFKIPAWHLIEMGNYGHDLNKIKEVPILQLDWKELTNNCTAFIDRYFSRLKSLI